MQADGFSKSTFHQLTVAHSKSVFSGLEVILKKSIPLCRKWMGFLLTEKLESLSKSKNMYLSNFL